MISQCTGQVHIIGQRGITYSIRDSIVLVYMRQQCIARLQQWYLTRKFGINNIGYVDIYILHTILRCRIDVYAVKHIRFAVRGQERTAYTQQAIGIVRIG
ncbi:hypothetical protein D3C72_705970 [compost metagenome]